MSDGWGRLLTQVNEWAEAEASEMIVIIVLADQSDTFLIMEQLFAAGFTMDVLQKLFEQKSSRRTPMLAQSSDQAINWHGICVTVTLHD